MTSDRALTSLSRAIERRIHLLRGEKVMLDSDLAALYGVSVKRLNEQVKRNRRRFPRDFMFRRDTRGSAGFKVADCDVRHDPSTPESRSLPLAFGIGYFADEMRSVPGSFGRSGLVNCLPASDRSPSTSSPAGLVPSCTHETRSSNALIISGWLKPQWPVTR